MKWYCVTSRYYDSGPASAAITGTVEADARPETEYKSLCRFDLWNEYFPDAASAAAAVEEIRNA